MSREIAEANAAVRMRLPFEDASDFDDARRRLVGTLSDGVIRGTDGRAGDRQITLRWVFTDTGDEHELTLRTAC